MKNITIAINYYWEKILAVLKVRQEGSGLEISDQILRFSFYNGKAWELYTTRLAPGIMEDGKIKNREAFIGALGELKSQIFKGRTKNKKVNVVISLSSANVYNQMFTLPLIGGEELATAVNLNMQMASPVDIATMYADWETAARDESAGHIEILSAFIDRATVDETVQALLEVGFVVMAVESKALVLTRMLREKGRGVDISKTYILVSVDNAGIEFLVIRKGELYFEYKNQWRDIADEKGQIATDVFIETIEKSFRQVLNFYSQHWPDSLGGVFISSAILYEEIQKVITAEVSAPILAYGLDIGGWDAPSDWFIALGCSIRAAAFEKGKKEISLLGVDAEDTFQNARFVDFMDFWRVFTPVVFGFLIVVFCVADLFIAHIETLSASDLSVANGSGGASGIADALSSAKDFNDSVSIIQSIESGASPKTTIITMIQNVASSSGIVATDISYPGGGSIALTGSASSENQIFSFEKSVQADAAFTNVDLPLSSIQKQPSGEAFSFTMTLAVK